MIGAPTILCATTVHENDGANPKLILEQFWLKPGHQTMDGKGILKGTGLRELQWG